MVSAISKHYYVVEYSNSHHKKLTDNIYNHIVDLVAKDRDIKFSDVAKSVLAEKYEQATIEVAKKDAAGAFFDPLSENGILAESPPVPIVNRQAQMPLSLPSEIPEDQKYAAWRKANGRNIVRFLEQGWPAPFIKEEMLDRAGLGKLDWSAYKAVDNLISRGKSLPDHLNLPTQAYTPVKPKLSHVEQQALREAEKTARELRSGVKTRK